MKQSLQSFDVMIEDIQKVEQLPFDDPFFGDESSIENIYTNLKTSMNNGSNAKTIFYNNLLLTEL